MDNLEEALEVSREPDLVADDQALSCPANWRPELSAPAPIQISHPTLGHPTKTWQYNDATGHPIFMTCRFETQDGRKAVLPLMFDEPDCQRGPRWKAPPRPRPLYGLDRLAARPDAAVLICEGEKAADAGGRLFPGHVAITSFGGAKAASKSNWAPLAGRQVVIWPDNDPEGQHYADDVAQLAAAAGATTVGMVQVPNEFAEKWDLADEPPPGWAPDGLRELVVAAKSRARTSTAGTVCPAPYCSREDGLWYRDPNPKIAEIRLCGPLKVLAETRDSDGSNWGVLLSWRDHDDLEHKWPMPRALLAGDSVELCRRLLDGGLFVAPGRKERELLVAHLASVSLLERVHAVRRIGWHGRVFALPDLAYGDANGERAMLQSLNSNDHAFRFSGTLDDWHQQIGRYAAGNSRLILAISTAFAAPLLHLAGVESGGLHFRGASSIGKTTALSVAGSVWGGGGVKGYIRQWRATDNGLEALAAMHCDALLCLDELSQVDPRAAGAAAYMLANGGGKSRSGRYGELRPAAEWRILFLSSGEIGLAEKLSEDGRAGRATAGQQVRIIEVPADAGAGAGMFECLHGFANGDALARHLKKAAGEFYGTAARAFLEQIVVRHDEVGAAVAGFRDEFLKERCSDAANGQVKRVAERFGLVAAGGELAIALGILPWEKGAAIDAAATCFKAWLGVRGGYGAAEIADGIRQVRRFIEQHGESRFSSWGMEGDGGDRPTINRAGFRRPNSSGGCEYYVLPEAWNGDVCAGFDAAAVARALMDRGLLTPDGADGKPQSRHRLPGTTNAVRCYRLSPLILGDGDA